MTRVAAEAPHLSKIPDLSFMRCTSKRFVRAVEAQWHGNGTVWAVRGHDLLKSGDAGETWSHAATIPAPWHRRALAAIPALRRLLRVGVRGYLRISDTELVLFCGGKILWWREGQRQLQSIGRVRRGRGPLVHGCCIDNLGSCYYGEYWSNADRDAVSLHTWQPGWPGWQPYYSFPSGAIRHIHAVQFDPVSERLWVCTGDDGSECRIGYFENRSGAAPQLKLIAEGNQWARAVSLLFTKEYVYWGSDGGRGTQVEANWIFRWCRRTGVIEKVAEIGAPAYYSAMDEHGRMFISTAVEGAASEQDRFVHVWGSSDGLNWEEVARWKKDRYPAIFGHGLVSFPGGIATDGTLYSVVNGVSGGTGTWVLTIESEPAEREAVGVGSTHSTRSEDTGA